MTFDLSGVVVHIRGLPVAVEQRLAAEWSLYAGASAPHPLLDVQVERSGRVVTRAPFAPKAMKAAFVDGTATYAMAEGVATVDARGQASVTMDDGDPQRLLYVFLNLVRGCLAWSLLSRRGALLHCAAMRMGERAFVLPGPGGSGKTTWAALGEGKGGVVITDDLVMLERKGDGVFVLGGPFRSTHRAPFRKGRWPLAAILLPVHGPSPRLARAPSMRVRARLAANLPFVQETLPVDPRPFDVVEDLVDAVPAYELTFAREPSFTDLLLGLN